MNLDKHRLTKNILMAAIMGASSVQVVVPPSLVEAANSVVANDTVPVHGEFITGGSGIINANGDIKGNLSVSQTGNNAVIKWNDFSIGANATVDFSKLGGGEFSTLNYVKNGGDLSQIYGTINANEGNIFIVNPAGVEIGNSAQINVGSLYVSNKYLNENNLNQFNGNNLGSLVDTTKTSNAELMSLGNINAGKVIFDGDRIVLDTERVKNGSEKLGADNIAIKTTNEAWENNDIVLGYDAYDEDGQTYVGKNTDLSSDKLANLIVKKDDGTNVTTQITKKDGYMWVKNGIQLQKMDTNVEGNYAFRNSIDLNSTAQTEFNAVGSNDNPFKGKVDGLGFDVYGLNIKENMAGNNSNVGLFGATDSKQNGDGTRENALIRNFNLISGSVTGENNVGAVVGNAKNTTIENVTNTLAVTGDKNVGGIVGTGENVTLNNVKNTGAVEGSQNVGGLAGSLTGSTIIGESYNLANVQGDENSHDIGGLVGTMSNSKIGNVTGKDDEGNPTVADDDFQIYNHLDVTGGYNVGGIVGSMTNSTVQNVANDGNVTAIGKKEDGVYEYHTNDGTKGANQNEAEIANTNVDIANVGGIVGKSDDSTISNVLNEGNVSSQLTEDAINGDYYIAGNVGGVVGRAEDTNITNATNKESNIRGAHNVGGVAGYFGGVATIKNGINNGGDIMATGARNKNNFVKESIRSNSAEEFIVGNMGGIAGYMYGDNAYITQSSNRGAVHTAEIKGNDVKNSSKAANVGGIVGKIDRTDTKDLEDSSNKKGIRNDITQAAVNNSYNTGDIRGYTGIGGVVGMMYNGEVASSYNLGKIQTTRIAKTSTVDPLNMGGVVGDTTEWSSANALIYDVYNKGQVGDENFNYYGRHVGGVVGRLSGDVEKAYNNGTIYNASTVTGGVVGWWFKGNISNVFNTGNITVENKVTGNPKGTEVGGVVGGAENYDSTESAQDKLLMNAYNLGIIRGFTDTDVKNTVGGIIGNYHAEANNGNLTIQNVYTLGKIYAGKTDGNGSYTADKAGSIWGGYEEKTAVETSHPKLILENAYYISVTGTDDSNSGIDYNEKITDNSTSKIEYGNRKNNDYYTNFDFGTDNSDFSGEWRIYEGHTTPILNAFIPDSSNYFNGNADNLGLEKNQIQYGTAYDPLLTIIKENSNTLNINWQKLGLKGDASLVVFNKDNTNQCGLNFTDFENLGGTGFYAGTIYTDGDLVINGKEGEDINLGSSSRLYGSSVTINDTAISLLQAIWIP